MTEPDLTIEKVNIFLKESGLDVVQAKVGDSVPLKLFEMIIALNEKIKELDGDTDTSDLLELDFRNLKAPLPVLRFKKLRTKETFNKTSKVKILLSEDIIGNQDDFITYNEMTGSRYKVTKFKAGVLLVPKGVPK